AVIYEGLRRHTPTWLLGRRAIDSATLGGTVVPGGSELVYSPTTLHRDPALFSAPTRFEPGRWLPDPATAARSHNFIPFGAGVRKCIGERFAMAEIATTVASIVPRCRLEHVPGSHVREHIASMLHPGPLPMIVRRRS